jgi:tRNA(His) 5'-end guanylyltransferase
MGITGYIYKDGQYIKKPILVSVPEVTRQKKKVEELKEQKAHLLDVKNVQDQSFDQCKKLLVQKVWLIDLLSSPTERAKTQKKIEEAKTNTFWKLANAEENVREAEAKLEAVKAKESKELLKTGMFEKDVEFEFFDRKK